MRIIFLDIDGVLNIMSNSYRTFMKPYGQHIEPHLVQRLNYLIEKTNANIVISSSWRGDMEDTEKQMNEQGFKHWDKVIGKTGRDKEGHRGNEIKEWLTIHKDNKIESFCVLEDETADVCGSKCRAIMAYHVVKVDMNEGLSDNNVSHAMGVLSKGLIGGNEF